MRPFRVAVLAPRSLPWHAYGGLERHVSHLCRALRREGVEVDLFTSSPEYAAEPCAGDSSFRHHVIPGRPFFRQRFAVVLSRNTLYPWFSLRMGYRVAQESRRRPFDTVFAEGLTAFGFAFWSPRLGIRSPLVLNPQGMEEAITPSLWKRLAYVPFRAFTRYAARRADYVVATDQVLVPVVQRVFTLPRERVLMIPNGIDSNECVGHVDPEHQRSVLATLGAQKVSPLIVSLGRLAPNKGFDVGLEAMARVCRSFPSSWRWILVGEGPMRRSLARRARDLGLSDHVLLAGNLVDRDVHNLLASADLFLNPTLYEGSSLVTLEAMAHARPIVATRAGGIPDKIEEGVTGWLAQPGEAEDLAAGILRWWKASSEERERIGRTARQRCLERFDWAVTVHRYIEIIRELTKKAEGDRSYG